MPRKTSKTITSQKKHTTVPPVAKPKIAERSAAATAVISTVKAAAPVAAVTPEITKEPTAVITAGPVDTATEIAAITPLIAALHDLDADIASEAATALGQLSNAAAVEPLIEIVSNTHGYFHSVVRSAAAASLGQLKDQRAVETLLNAVFDPIADPSTEAIRALAAIGDVRAVETFISVVRNRDGFFANGVRRAAVLGLIKLGGEQAQAELLQISSDGWEDAVIREEATAAINAN